MQIRVEEQQREEEESIQACCDEIIEDVYHAATATYNIVSTVTNADTTTITTTAMTFICLHCYMYIMVVHYKYHATINWAKEWHWYDWMAMIMNVKGVSLLHWLLVWLLLVGSHSGSSAAFTASPLPAATIVEEGGCILIDMSVVISKTGRQIEENNSLVAAKSFSGNLMRGWDYF